MAPKKYINQMTVEYKNMFGEDSLTKFKFSMEKGDYIGLDASEFITPDDIHKYQSLN